MFSILHGVINVFSPWIAILIVAPQQYNPLSFLGLISEAIILIIKYLPTSLIEELIATPDRLANSVSFNTPSFETDASFSKRLLNSDILKSSSTHRHVLVTTQRNSMYPFSQSSLSVLVNSIEIDVTVKKIY